MDNTQKNGMKLWKKIAIGFIVLVLIVRIGKTINGDTSKETSSNPEKTVVNDNEFTKAKMGEAWPFRDIESGVVSCTPEGGVIFEANNGKTYAINGWARTLKKSKYPGWVDSEEIHILGKDVGPILSKGNELCKFR